MSFKISRLTLSVMVSLTAGSTEVECNLASSPPKHLSEDSLLSAMERAGSEDMGDDVERKGLGTPQHGRTSLKSWCMIGAYIIPEGLEDYSYTKAGKIIKGT